jgi:PQQ-dependent catabolism-associated CXXCW motif protein
VIVRAPLVLLLGLACLATLDAGTALAEQSPEPEGYRLSDYKAPVPATLKGAKPVDTHGAYALWAKGEAVFIDVLPQAPRPANLPAATIWRDKPREDIPRSIWLPDTGYGELHPSMQAYFRDGLQRASLGDKAAVLVFYCLADCWQSWNAAKRAVSLGYTAVIWYPDGTTGWEEAGYPLEPRSPEPRPLPN